jgi:hypothetical protein
VKGEKKRWYIHIMTEVTVQSIKGDHLPPANMVTKIDLVAYAFGRRGTPKPGSIIENRELKNLRDEWWRFVRDAVVGARLKRSSFGDDQSMIQLQFALLPKEKAQ